MNYLRHFSPCYYWAFLPRQQLKGKQIGAEGTVSATITFQGWSGDGVHFCFCFETGTPFSEFIQMKMEDLLLIKRYSSPWVMIHPMFEKISWCLALCEKTQTNTCSCCQRKQTYCTCNVHNNYQSLLGPRVYPALMKNSGPVSMQVIGNKKQQWSNCVCLHQTLSASKQVFFLHMIIN